MGETEIGPKASSFSYVLFSNSEPRGRRPDAKPRLSTITLRAKRICLPCYSNRTEKAIEK
jgi:hypothetical protein